MTKSLMAVGILFLSFVGVQANADHECNHSVIADVHTVTELRQCGVNITNSGVRGVVNRGRNCTEEHVVAQVFASTRVCNSCQTQSRLSEIRCERGAVCGCQTPGYIEALIADLASESRRVRLASKTSLRLCGLRVQTRRDCVDAPVPSIYWH